MNELKPGQTVVLRGTDRRYIIESIYSTCPFKKDNSTVWCRLTNKNNRPAYWMACQLEAIT